MLRFTVGQLRDGVKLTRPIFHEGGAVLHEIGEEITRFHKVSLAVSGIQHVYQPDQGEGEREVRHTLSTRLVQVASLSEDAVLASDIVVSKGTLLAREGAVIDDNRRMSLLRNGIREVPIRKSAEERKDQQVLAYRAFLRRAVPPTEYGRPGVAPSHLERPPEPAVSHPPELAHITPSTPPASTQAARILVVDDTQHVRRIVRVFLEKQGYEVIEASDGIEALRRLMVQEVDLILLDLHMPRMDGLTLLDRLARREETRDIPVVICSSGNTTDHVVGAIARGVKGYVIKPFSRACLLEVVAKGLSAGSVTPSHPPDQLSKKTPGRRPPCLTR